ncbi:MAG: RNA methyltransferase [Candidatus Kapabacteria bacterium]|nr:RNA methyltransferase [Ignavibacteriota bacterium]MCW5885571.1 RNA methyltransferase [Candidatus Kapabacteria bacterium]
MLYTMQVSQKLKKLIRSLHQKPFRDQNGLFVAEGERLVSELTKSGFTTELVVLRDSPTQDVLEIAEYYSEKGVPVYAAQKHLFDQLTDTKSPQSILAVVNIQTIEPDYSKPFIALDGVADPGNVGTIIRTANWFGFDQILIGRDCADCYNPKTVRSTMGAIFKTAIHYAPDLAGYINEHYKGFDILGATLNTDDTIEKTKVKKKFGVVFGSEAKGISDDVNEILTKKFKIVGFGDAESLNVAVAAGISMHHFKDFLK